MPKVNVVTSDGRVVAVEEGDATEITSASTQQAAESARQRLDEEQSGGLAGTAGAFVEGAADAATLGGYGAARRAYSDAYATSGARDYANRAQQHGAARLLGEAAAVLAPTGLLGKGAASVAGATGIGLASRVGSRVAASAGTAAGVAVEGAILGAGAQVAQSSVTGDPLTIESTVAGAGVGAILGVGMAGLGSLVTRGARRAGDAVRKIEEGAAARRIASLDDAAVPAYRELRAAHEAAESAAIASNKVALEAQEAYTKFAQTGFRDAVKDTRNAIHALRAEASAQHTAARLQAVEQRAATGAVGEETAAVVATSKQRLTDLSGAQDRLQALSTLKDKELAISDLRTLHSELGLAKVIPDAPPSVQPVSGVKLPETVAEFARLRPDTVAKLSETLSPEAGAAVGRVADQLGLAQGATAVETLAAVRQTLSKQAKASKATGNPLMDLLKRGVGGALGGFAGGPVGAIAGASIAGEGVLGALTNKFQSKLDTVFLGSKLSTVGRLSSIVETGVRRTGAAVTKMAPVTAWLGSTLSGDPDPSPLPQQTINRVNELASLGTVAGDAAYMAVQPLLSHPGELGLKVAQLINHAVEYLQANAPAPHPSNHRMGGSDWTPEYHESLILAHRMEATLAPLQAIERAMSGDGHPAAIDTLWTVYPALMDELAGQVSINPATSEATYQQASLYSEIFRRPMSGLQEPATVALVQSLYSQPNQQPPGASSARRPAPTGRPPKVTAPKAGSSVDALIAK